MDDKSSVTNELKTHTRTFAHLSEKSEQDGLSESVQLATGIYRYVSIVLLYRI